MLLIYLSFDDSFDDIIVIIHNHEVASTTNFDFSPVSNVQAAGRFFRKQATYLFSGQPDNGVGFFHDLVHGAVAAEEMTVRTPGLGRRW